MKSSESPRTASRRPAHDRLAAAGADLVEFDAPDGEVRRNIAALIESMDRIADEREAFKAERNDALAKVKAVQALADEWAAHIEGCAGCDYGEQLAELRAALAVEPTP